tara:strand:- start:4787 stop:5647 length:861 start_codon:yes stop_codon:yes gene_type:complete
MFRSTVPIANIAGVGAGQTTTIDLPTNRRYHALYLEYRESGVMVTKANMEAAILNIRISLNSRVQREYSAAELNVMNAVNGARWVYQNGIIAIFFSEPWRRSAGGEDALAWSLAGNGVNSFQIEIEVAAGRVSPSFVGRAIVDYAKMPDGKAFLPLGPIVTTRRRTITVSGTGSRSLIDFPRELGNYNRLHAFEDTAGDIASLRVNVNSTIVFDRSDALNIAILSNGGFVPQTALFHAVFDDDQRVGDGLPMRLVDGSLVSELSLEYDMAVASNFVVISELIGAPS